MQQKKIQIINKLGLHTRAAVKLVNLTCKYTSTIDIILNQKKINGKSIMEVLTLAATKGTILNIITEGDDEIELMHSIEKLITDKFDEDE